MSVDVHLTRRALLRLLAWWAALAAAPLRASSSEPAPGGDAIAGRLLRHRASAVAIGRQFLREHPEEADGASLLRHLGLPATSAGIEDAGIAEQRLRLQALHGDDFREGRAVVLGGWVLSHTEVRLAALVALAPAGPDAP